MYSMLGAVPTLTPVCTSPLTAKRQKKKKNDLEHSPLNIQSFQTIFKSFLRKRALNLRIALVCSDAAYSQGT